MTGSYRAVCAFRWKTIPPTETYIGSCALKIEMRKIDLEIQQKLHFRLCVSTQKHISKAFIFVTMLNWTPDCHFGLLSDLDILMK